MTEITEFSHQFAAGVIELIVPIQQTEFGISITLEAQPDLQDVESYYQHGCGNFWVAVDGLKVVGSIALLDIGRSQVALRKMFVAKGYRGGEQGIANGLLEQAIYWCKIKSVTPVSYTHLTLPTKA